MFNIDNFFFSLLSALFAFYLILFLYFWMFASSCASITFISLLSHPVLNLKMWRKKTVFKDTHNMLKWMKGVCEEWWYIMRNTSILPPTHTHSNIHNVLRKEMVEKITLQSVNTHANENDEVEDEQKKQCCLHMDVEHYYTYRVHTWCKQKSEKVWQQWRIGNGNEWNNGRVRPKPKWIHKSSLRRVHLGILENCIGIMT